MADLLARGFSCCSESGIIIESPHFHIHVCALSPHRGTPGFAWEVSKLSLRIAILGSGAR